MKIDGEKETGREKMENQRGGDVKPSLLHKLEGSTNEIHAAVIIPGIMILYKDILQKNNVSLSTTSNYGFNSSLNNVRQDLAQIE